MITLVIGGSCSGKSEYAEHLLDRAADHKIYLATMRVFDAESRERVHRHRERRSERGFTTIECPSGLFDAAACIPPGSSVLLEGIGTLAANELFDCSPERDYFQSAVVAKDRILTGVFALADRSGDLVIVSDEVNRAGCEYEGDTLLYQRLVGELNQELCRGADRVIEMVCGIPVTRKRSFGSTDAPRVAYGVL